MHQDVYRQVEIAKAINTVTRKHALLRDRVNDRVLVSNKTGLLIHTRLQTIFNLKFDSPVEQSVHEIIMGHAIAAERAGPGGFDICVELLLKKFESQHSVTQPNNHYVNSSDIVGSGAMVPTICDIDWATSEYTNITNTKTKSMLKRAIQLAGFGGRIIIEKAKSDPTVELVRGYSFEQVPAWPISVKLEKPKVVCIDGFIESVSELHHLLEAASETKESVLLFVRGMSDDVKNTLKVNYDRGTLRVIPIIVKFDLEGINAINDIAISSGAELISSNKGDSASNIKFNEISRIDEATVHATKVVINNVSSRRAVEAHVSFLRRKRLEQKDDDVGRLFDLRIKSLSPNHVIIRLSDDKDYVTSSQAIDYALRAVKALVDHGTLLIDDKKILTVTAIASQIHSNRCYKTLTSLGAMLII